MTDFRLLYMTAGDEAEARRIGRALVEERLVACVNILPGMQSIYRWEGQVEEASEVVLIAKTREERVEAVKARIQALHSYDCPCLLSLSVEDGLPAYLKWLREESS